MARHAAIDVVWVVEVDANPAVIRHCRTCNGSSPFVSSDKFRVNARGRRLDVWLIYRCAHCASTWNRALWVRARSESLGAARYQALLSNDPTIAREVARDVEHLTRSGHQVAMGDAVRVRGDAVDPRADVAWRIRFVLAAPCQIRLDKAVAQGLGVSRSTVREWIGSRRLGTPAPVECAAGVGRVAAAPALGAWKRPVRNGRTVMLEAPP